MQWQRYFKIGKLFVLISWGGKVTVTHYKDGKQI